MQMMEVSANLGNVLHALIGEERTLGDSEDSQLWRGLDQILQPVIPETGTIGQVDHFEGV